MMKLLTPKEVRHKKRVQVTQEVIRSKNIRDYVNKGVKELNDLKNNRVGEKERIEKDFHDFREGVEIDKQRLEKEVVALEERKKDALIPVKALEEEAKDKLKTAITIAEKVEVRELSVKEWDRDVAQKEIYIDSVIERTKEEFSKDREAITREKKKTKAQTGVLKRKETKLEEKSKKIIEKLAGQQLKLDVKADMLNAKDLQLTKTREFQEEERKRIAKEDIIIKDKYIALEQAKIHLNLKDK